MGQAELVEAAGQARVKASEAHESLVDAAKACHDRAQTLTALQTQLAADREALADAMEELGHATGEAAQKLENAVNAAAVAVGGIDDAADVVSLYGANVLDAVTHDLDEAASTLTRLTTDISGAVEHMKTLQHTAFTRVGTDAVWQLESEASSAGSNLVFWRSTRLERLTPALAELMDDALGLLETTLPTELEKAVAAWGSRDEHTLGQVAEAFTSLMKHADEITHHCASDIGTRLDAERDTLTGEATRIAGDLHSLTTSLGERRAALEAALQAVAESFSAQQTELREITSQLEQVRFRWSSFGFA